MTVYVIDPDFPETENSLSFVSPSYKCSASILSDVDQLNPTVVPDVLPFFSN